MDMNNPVREKPIYNNDMDKFLEENNQEAPFQVDSYSFPFFVNIGDPLMATFNIPVLNLGLPT
jgi:hypothetical protein